MEGEQAGHPWEHAAQKPSPSCPTQVVQPVELHQVPDVGEFGDKEEGLASLVAQPGPARSTRHSRPGRPTHDDGTTPGGPPPTRTAAVPGWSEEVVFPPALSHDHGRRMVPAETWPAPSVCVRVCSRPLPLAGPAVPPARFPTDDGFRRCPGRRPCFRDTGAGMSGACRSPLGPGGQSAHGSRTTLPVVCRSSISRCASAAADSGSRQPMSSRSRPMRTCSVSSSSACLISSRAWAW